jgi:hypothetical protein
VRPLNQLVWLLAAAASACACRFAIAGTTPVDRALPLFALAVGFVAWVACDARILTAVPVLMIAENALVDEHLRLLFLGAIVTCALAVAVRWEMTYGRATAIGVAAIVLLRWIPFAEVTVWRELVLMGGLLALLGRERMRTPLGLAAAVAFALVVPARPARMLIAPLLVAALPWYFAAPVALLALFLRPPLASICIAAALALLARLVRRPSEDGNGVAALEASAASAPPGGAVRWKAAQVPLLAIAALAFALFPWSGVVARGPSFFLHRPRTALRHPIGIALAPGESATISLPPNATSLIVFGANASTLRPGTLLGMAGATPIRIGDAADWGYMRPENWFQSRNVVPHRPAGPLRGYGAAAWAHGEGAIPIPPGTTSLRVRAAADLPGNARLQIDSAEVGE